MCVDCAACYYTTLMDGKDKLIQMILTFLIARKNDVLEYTSNFNHYNVTNVRLFLNDKYYLYDNLNIDGEKEGFVLLYDMYVRCVL